MMQRIYRQAGKRAATKKKFFWRKVLIRLTGLTAILSLATPLWAMPAGGEIKEGAAQITGRGPSMTITQTTPFALIHWRKFGIQAGERVTFNQPSARAIIVNRVIGKDPSVINGQLLGNGRIFLVNPQGILIGPSGEVNTGSFLAAAADSWEKSQDHWKAAAAGSIINQGKITVHPQGFLILVGKNIENNGSLTAKQGEINLESGGQFDLSWSQDERIHFAITAPTKNAFIKNQGVICAEDGRIYLSARSSGTTMEEVLTNSGRIAAQRIHSTGGKIYLDGGSVGVVSVSGNIDGSGKAGSEGGSVNILGDQIAVTGQAVIDASGKQGGRIQIGDAAKTSTVSLGAGASIAANAETDGNGGSIQLFSRKTTSVLGLLSACGGSSLGDGGQIETSSGGTLTVLGKVIAGASQGKAGQWLMDPDDITISNEEDWQSGSLPDRSSGSILIFPNGTRSVVSARSIENSLNQDTSVIVSTGWSDGNGGNITIADHTTIIKSGGVGATLTLLASKNIVMGCQSEIKTVPTNSGGVNPLTVQFLANREGSGGGILLKPGAIIDSGGGDILLSSPHSPALGSDLLATGISLDGATLCAGSGKVTLRGKGRAGANYGVSLLNQAVINSDGGIELDGSAGDRKTPGVFIDGTVKSIGGTITIQSDGGVTEASHGKIQSSELNINSGGDALLTAGRNQVGTIYGKSDHFQYVNQGDIKIGDQKFEANHTFQLSALNGSITLPAASCLLAPSISLQADQNIILDGSLQANNVSLYGAKFPADHFFQLTAQAISGSPVFKIYGQGTDDLKIQDFQFTKDHQYGFQPGKLFFTDLAENVRSMLTYDSAIRRVSFTGKGNGGRIDSQLLPRVDQFFSDDGAASLVIDWLNNRVPAAVDSPLCQNGYGKITYSGFKNVQLINTQPNLPVPVPEDRGNNRYLSVKAAISVVDKELRSKVKSEHNQGPLSIYRVKGGIRLPSGIKR